MRIYKKILSVTVFILMLTLSVSSAPKYFFKIASDAMDGTSWIVSIKQLNDKLLEKTNGQVGVQVFAGGVMGDESTVIKKIKIGQLTGSTFSSGGMGLIYKDFSVMGFPMIFRSYEEYDYVKLKMFSFFEAEFQKRGFELLTLTEVGIIYLYSSKKVNSIETLRNAKPFLRDGDNISKELFSEIKANPIPLQISDIMTSLQTGQIDTVFSSPAILAISQWYTKVKYMADFPVTLMIGGILVDKKLFDSMPAGYQKEMKTMFRTTFDNLNTKVRKDDKDTMESLKRKAGIVVLPVSDKDKEIFENACSNVANKLTEKEYSRELLNKIKGYVADYRKSKK